MQKILTVSVAGHNVEKYITEALSSLAQSRFLDELEIFVVDDGGTDGTFETAQRYAEKHPRSFFAVHKANGGYGSTVNYSLAHATGKYFKLLDGDDSFVTKALDALVRFLSAHDEDVVYMPHTVNRKGKLREVNVGEAVTSFEAWHGNTALLTMHGLCFKTAVLKDIALTLPEHCLYTDSLFSICAFAGVRSAVYFPHAVYSYRLGRNGQSMSRQSRSRHYDDMENILFRLIDFCRVSVLNTDYMRACTASHACMTLKVLLFDVSRAGLRKVKDLENRIKNADVEIYSRMAETGKMGKLIKIFRKTGYGAYWLVGLLPSGLIK